jgi:hypothetical protein
LTVLIFCNSNLLTDIHDAPEPLILETNGGGHQVSNQMGTITNLGTVWYNPESIANILSRHQLHSLPFYHRHWLTETRLQYKAPQVRPLRTGL